MKQPPLPQPRWALPSCIPQTKHLYLFCLPLFGLPSHLSIIGVSSEVSEVESILRPLQNEQLKGFVRTCKASKKRASAYKKALYASFLEGEKALPVVGYILDCARKQGVDLPKNRLMKKALKYAPRSIIELLLEQKIYNPHMLAGGEKYLFREMMGLLWPRFFSSVMLMTPYWCTFITTYILPSSVALPLLLLQFSIWLCGGGKLVNQFPWLGWVVRCIQITYAMLKIGVPMWNTFYILHILKRLPQAGYLILVIRGERPTEEKNEIVALLLAHEANPMQTALCVTMQEKATQMTGIPLYTFEEKGAIHFAVECNLVDIVEMLYAVHPAVVHQKAYCMQDPYPKPQESSSSFSLADLGESSPYLLPDFISIQTLYTKEGTEKEMETMKVLFPFDFALHGSHLAAFLRQKSSLPS